MTDGELSALIRHPNTGAVLVVADSTPLAAGALSAGVSLLRSLFNLLPILPLDGGRIFSIIAAELLGGRRGDALTKGVSLTLATARLLAGTLLMWRGEGTALTIVSLWLLLAQPDKAVLVKRRELL